MSAVGGQACPLPADPVLGAMAVAMRDAGQWGELVDRSWVWSYMTDDLRLSYGGLLEFADVALGEHYAGPTAVQTRLGLRPRGDTPPPPPPALSARAAPAPPPPPPQPPA